MVRGGFHTLSHVPVTPRPTHPPPAALAAAGLGMAGMNSSDGPPGLSSGGGWGAAAGAGGLNATAMSLGLAGLPGFPNAGGMGGGGGLGGDSGQLFGGNAYSGAFSSAFGVSQAPQALPFDLAGMGRGILGDGTQPTLR